MKENRMTPVREQGKLIKWNDDKGFGFIQPEAGGRHVFLHVSALIPAARRPQTGDTIFYEPTVQAAGKIRASNAFLVGVPVLPVARGTTRNQQGWLETVIGVAVVAAAVAFFALRPNSNRSGASASTSAPWMDDAPQMDIPPPPDYTIKGNVSVGTGARIYHVPSSEDYEITMIDPTRGERWFRSEAEAVASGWRKARYPTQPN